MTSFFIRAAKRPAPLTFSFLSILLIGSLSAPVFAQTKSSPQITSEAYAEYYGNGLRSYTEGNYVEAIDQLFRAFALQQSPDLLRLIIRSYDAMGHCDAAQKQRTFFQDLYPRDLAPPPDQCQSTAALTIECTPVRTPVTVNYVIDSYCGATLNLAPGNIHIESPSHGSSQSITLQKGEQATAQIKLNAEKWPQIETVDASNHNQPLIRVPRLPTRQSEYAVYQSRDGLYQIWVRAELRSEQDLSANPGFSIQPRVEIVCAEDGMDEDRDCMFLRSIQERSPHYTDNPQRYRMSVPIIP